MLCYTRTIWLISDWYFSFSENVPQPINTQEKDVREYAAQRSCNLIINFSLINEVIMKDLYWYMCSYFCHSADLLVCWLCLNIVNIQELYVLIFPPVFLQHGVTVSNLEKPKCHKNNYYMTCTSLLQTRSVSETIPDVTYCPTLTLNWSVTPITHLTKVLLSSYMFCTTLR